MPKIDLLCIIILICTIRRLGHRNRQSFHAAQASIRQPVGCRQTSNGSWADKQWVVGRQAMARGQTSNGSWADKQWVVKLGPKACASGSTKPPSATACSPPRKAASEPCLPTGRKQAGSTKNAHSIEKNGPHGANEANGANKPNKPHEAHGAHEPNGAHEANS